MKNKQKINWRSFVSIYMAYSFLMMIITGIVLYIAPPGRIAHWSNWLFLGFTKTQWEAFHTLFSFIWIVVAIYHIIYNWKPLIFYIKRKTKENLKLNKEFGIATLFTILIFAGTYFEIPPFSSIMDLGDYFTNSWASEENEPPVPHAELMTIGEFSRTVNIPKDKILKTIKANGITIRDTTLTLKEISEENDISPSKIYNLLKTNSGSSNNSTKKYLPGTGFGRKNLSEIFKENKIDWAKGIQKLKSKGIIVKEDAALKEIAQQNKITPKDIITALELN